MKILFTLLLMLSPLSAFAKSVHEGQAFSYYLENDSRDLGGPGSDNSYSSGTRLSYIMTSDRTPKWAESIVLAPQLLDPSFKVDYANFGISLGHQIYTPNDIRETQLIVTDRPYAAWLYVGLMAQFKNESRSHVFELDIGIIGPEAGGEKMQNEYHRIIKKYYAEGWRHQLATEPTIQLSYQQRQKFIEFHDSKYRKYFDALPLYGVSLGNVAIDAHIGAVMRFGMNLPNDFGPRRASATEGDMFLEPQTTKNTSVYTFVGARGLAIARNIFLDGNTFKSSHRVQKNPVMLETEIGLGLAWQDWNFAWRFVSRSPEFKERTVYNSFASISLSTLF